jgi:HSP20 family molecular chaperone IbpA
VGNGLARAELPEEIKTDEVEAELKDGILEVALPKKASKHKKKGNVKQNRDGKVVKNPLFFRN